MIAKGVINIIPIHIGPKDKILIIAPHPDDECIGPGGVLCTYSSQCDVIVLTDGAQGQGNLPADECRRIRKKEFMDEMEVLGIKKYRMEGIADGTLLHHTDCLERYDLSQYSKIFVTGTGDHHADHTAAYVSLVQALKYSQADGTEIYLYEVHNPMEQPTHYFDITECVEAKCNLIQKHRSQLGAHPYDQYARIAAQYRALQNRMPGRYLEVYTKTQAKDFLDRKAMELENEAQKFKLFYHVLTRWMLNGENCIADKLAKKNVSTYVVYGYAELGKILRKQLEPEGFELLYIFDQKMTDATDGIKIYKPQAGLPDADIIIVTAVYYYEEIRKELSKMGYQHICSLQDLL